MSTYFDPRAAPKRIPSRFRRLLRVGGEINLHHTSPPLRMWAERVVILNWWSPACTESAAAITVTRKIKTSFDMGSLSLNNSLNLDQLETKASGERFRRVLQR